MLMIIITKKEVLDNISHFCFIDQIFELIYIIHFSFLHVYFVWQIATNNDNFFFLFVVIKHSCWCCLITFVFDECIVCFIFVLSRVSALLVVNFFHGLEVSRLKVMKLGILRVNNGYFCVRMTVLLLQTIVVYWNNSLNVWTFCFWYHTILSSSKKKCYILTDTAVCYPMFFAWPWTKTLPYSILHENHGIDLIPHRPLRRIACVYCRY